MKFYRENEINIIFKSPYMSQWNAIELAFRAIKRQYYPKIFENDEKLKNFIKEIINSAKFSETINFNFAETLKEYRRFIIDNKDANLNSIDVE